MRFKKHTLRSSGITSSGRVSCSKLLGLDSSISANEVSMSRADGKSYFYGSEMPGTVNMIRTGLGEVSKRPGFAVQTRTALTDNINGVLIFHEDNTDVPYYICTDSVVRNDEKLYVFTDFADAASVQVGKSFVLFSKGNMLIYNTEKQNCALYRGDGGVTLFNKEIVYTPTVFIAGKPNGEAVAYQPVNLINPYVCEMFAGDGSSTIFNLHFQPLDDITAYVGSDDSGWTQTEVKIQDSCAVFSEAPPKPSATGEDNVRITYIREGYEEGVKKISNSTCVTLFGIAGYEDRMFVANENTVGTVYYSEPDKPFYFPDLNYIKVGSESTHVKALAGQDLSLSVICNDNVYTVGGKAIEDIEGTDYTETAAFYVTGTLKTPTAYKVPPVIFDNEINYMTKDGVCAITASGVLDERCCQIRSSFINYHLLNEDLSNCQMLTYDDFLVISNRKNRLYLLDGKQFSQNGDLPFSQRQYEGYIWEDIPAKHIWVMDGSLYFSDGIDIFMFNKGESTNSEYSDRLSVYEQRAIAAYWETPYIHCSDFAVYKHFMRLGVLLDNKIDTDGFAFNTDVRVYVKFDNDDWRLVRDYDGKYRSFSYENFDYGKMTYRSSPKNYTVYCRLLHKKARAIKLRFENTNKNEPFTIQGYNIEYIQM